MEFLGDRIRNLRESSDLKQKVIAEKLLIKENTWSQYENNKRTPDLDTLKKIANLFSVSIDYLLFITDEVYNPHDNDFRELIHIYCSLNEESRKRLISEINKLKIERR